MEIDREQEEGFGVLVKQGAEAEARSMTKLHLDGLTLEYVDGPSIGAAVDKLHDGGLVHGDLKTSNMIVQNGTNQLVLIDLGLSFTSTLPEDKAVDLYVLMDRILSAYGKYSKQWSSTLNKLPQVRQRGWKPAMVGRAFIWIERNVTLPN